MVNRQATEVRSCLRMRTLRRSWLCVLAAGGVYEARALATAAATGASQLAVAATEEVPRLPALMQVMGGSLEAFSSLEKDVEHLQADALAELARAKALYDQHLADEHNKTRSLQVECKHVAKEIRTLQKNIAGQEHEVVVLRQNNALLQQSLRDISRDIQATLAAAVRASPTSEGAPPADDGAAAADSDGDAAEVATVAAAQQQVALVPAPQRKGGVADAQAGTQDAPELAVLVVESSENDGAAAATFAADDAGDAEDAAAGGGYGVLSFLAAETQVTHVDAIEADAKAFERRLQSLESEVVHAKQQQSDAVLELKRIFEADYAKEQKQEAALHLQLRKLQVARDGLLAKQRKETAILNKLQEAQKVFKGFLHKVSPRLVGRDGPASV